MKPRQNQNLWTWFKTMFFSHKRLSPETQQAMDLIAAIDAGGLPLNPARVNQIAAQLGLEVSKKAPVSETISRIRSALACKGL